MRTAQLRPSTTRSAPTELDVADLWSLTEVVVEPIERGIGSWVGAPSAVLVDGVFVLAYRSRRPIGHGRGIANVIATSSDGVRFTEVVQITKDRFDTDSMERPALVRTAEGTWRLYVSLATVGTKHWRVELLEADTLAGLATATARVVLAGSPTEAVKDPVILQLADGWHLWASVHPLDDPDATDRMVTKYATSPDGLVWSWESTALTGGIRTWDARGVRVSAVVPTDDGVWATYDGRATAEENWEERTGLAVGSQFGSLVANGSGPVLESPYAPSGFRYVSVVNLPDGAARWYFEVTRPDGAHELRTVLIR